MFRGRTGLALGTVLALGACSRPVPPPPPPPIDIVLTDYAFEAPDTLPSGWTTFQAVNRGTHLHQASLVRLDSGRTISDFTAALHTGEGLPAWASFVGGLQSASQVTIDLRPGRYGWICFIPDPDGKPHFLRGMVVQFTVTDSANGHPAPVADLQVTAHDYGWGFSTPLTAGKHIIEFRVAPGQPHEFVLARLSPGKHPQDLLDWINKQDGPPPAERIEGVTAMSSDYRVFESVDLQPGTYAVFCVVPDAGDHRPHAEHGMVQEVTVS